MLKIAVAVAFTGAIVLASGDADARARFRTSSPSPKPAAATARVAKPAARQPQKAGPAEPQKPFAAARPANPQPVGGGTFVVIRGPRPADAASGQSAAQQRALGDDSSGPLQFDPTLAAADDKAAEPKKAAVAAPATECIAPAQAVAAKEPLVAKNQQVAVNDAPKIEPAPRRVNPALVPVKPKRQAAPVVAAVCYVQRDGSCVPSF